MPVGTIDLKQVRPPARRSIPTLGRGPRVLLETRYGVHQPCNRPDRADEQLKKLPYPLPRKTPSDLSRHRVSPFIVDQRGVTRLAGAACRPDRNRPIAQIHNSRGPRTLGASTDRLQFAAVPLPVLPETTT